MTEPDADLKLAQEAAVAAKEKGFTAGGAFNGHIFGTLMKTGGFSGKDPISSKIGEIIAGVERELKAMGDKVAEKSTSAHQDGTTAVQNVTETEDENAQRLGK